MDIKVKKLNPNDFDKFGQIVCPNPKDEPTASGDSFNYFKQQAVFKIDGDSEFGILTIKKYDMVFDQIEQHVESPEIMFSLNGSFIVPVAPPSEDVPKPEDIEAFEVPHNHGIVLKDGCWHWMPSAVTDETATLLILFKDDTSANDLVIKDLTEQCKVTW